MAERPAKGEIFLMRPEVTKKRLFEFMRFFADRLGSGGRVYLTGGASALLQDWRLTTIDVDLSASPEPQQFFAAIAETKNALQINIELVSPADFVPVLPGWEGRSQFIQDFGRIAFYHYDFYSQAFSKLARAHPRDLADVENMRLAGLVKPARLKELFGGVSAEIIRYPSLSEAELRKKIDDWCVLHS